MITRDPNSRAVINKDLEALNKYKTERLYYKRVDRLQNDVVEIQSTLVRICERIDALEKKHKNG